MLELHIPSELRAAQETELATVKTKGGDEQPQPALPGLGPAAADPFQFTWWTTPEGAAVWVEVRGNWLPGVVIGRGRERVVVEVEGAKGRRTRVRRHYEQLRRRSEGAGKPAPTRKPR